MAAVILLKYLLVLAAVSLIFGALRIVQLFRARAMRALAARWDLKYIGPPAPKWWNPPHLKISPPLPVWFSEFYPSGRRVRQVWNVIEARQNGVSVFIFDAVVGEYRGGAPCTVIACQTEQNPFGAVSSPVRVIQSHGWTVLHGVWFLQFPWTMGIKRLDNYVKELRARSALRA